MNIHVSMWPITTRVVSCGYRFLLVLWRSTSKVIAVNSCNTVSSRDCSSYSREGKLTILIDREQYDDVNNKPLYICYRKCTSVVHRCINSTWRVLNQSDAARQEPAGVKKNCGTLLSPEIWTSRRYLSSRTSFPPQYLTRSRNELIIWLV